MIYAWYILTKRTPAFVFVQPTTHSNMDDFIFDIGGFDDMGDNISLPESDVARVPELEAYYMRSHAYWLQVPMPAELAPTAGAPLALLDDDTLLTMSPTLLVHAQRTAASGGLQVVSPRTVPLAMCAAHTCEARRAPDMFIVGSNASRNSEWPVHSQPIAPHLLAGEPIDAHPYDPALRPPTRSTGVVNAAQRDPDPVVRAFLVGRALVDLQRRPDVAGSGDALAAHIASAWGLSSDTYEGMAQASLAPQGPLLRYAVRADDAYPVLNAPVHARKCISVGANSMGRHLFGEDAAIDWRRIRVLCEAVFYMSSRLEGHTLDQMTLDQPPGDPRASPLRPGIVQMRPLPGSVWTHAPSTFRLDVHDTSPVSAAVHLPDRISAAVDAFMASARPVALAASGLQSLDLVPTARRRAVGRTGDELTVGYQRVMSNALSFSVRGRTAVAAVRDFMYQYLTGTPGLATVRTLWLARYLRETIAQCGLTTQVDGVLVRHLASRFSDMAQDLRVKLATEANRRGSTLEEWWADTAALLPSSLARLTEGSASWSVAIAHMLILPTTHKWSALTGALAYQSHRSLAATRVRDIRLPARIRSPARVFEALQATCRGLASSYGAYYSAMYEVGCMLAAQMRRLGGGIAAEKMRMAAMMWDIRAKATSTAEVCVAETGEVGTLGKLTGPYRITTSPHAAYTRWRTEVLASRSVSAMRKQDYPHHLTGPISAVFAEAGAPLTMSAGTGGVRLFRYLNSPPELGHDIESSLRMIHDDLELVAAQFELEELPADQASPVAMRAPGFVADLARFKPAADSYWMMLTRLEQADALEAEDIIGSLDIATSRAITSDAYRHPEDLLRAVHAAAADRAEAAERTRDTII